MNSSYDVVVIGGGHNGLVAAAYLADSGKRVLVLEARDVLGGAAATEEIFPGYKVDTGASHIGLFRSEIITELGLEKHGLELLDSPMNALSLAQGETLRLWSDPEAARQDIERHSSMDAARYQEFQEWLANQASILRSAHDRVPPRMSSNGIKRDLIAWSPLALQLRRRGRKAVTEFLRTIPISAEQLLDEWFENPLLKGTLAASGIEGSMQGPKASGTGLMLLYQGVNGFPPLVRYVRGGTGALATSLADTAAKRGAEIQTGVRVERVLISDYRANGVALSNGQEVSCEAIASGADPRHTLLNLVGATNLELRVMRRTRNVRFRGSTAKVNLALDGVPGFIDVQDPSELTGRILVSPSTEYLERAYDDAKYRRWSRTPYLDISIPTLMDGSRAPEGKHVLSATMRYAPYQLAETDWESAREAFGDHVVASIAKYAPDLHQLILHRQVLTPLDYENEYGLPEGSIYHGQMALDQLLTMRPIPGYGRYQSPVEGLYFCGAGAHPGGGVSGVPGRNAARVIVKDLKRN
ncbi:MAG: phytoene desaturase family protein [Anaerolineales bacterium]